MSKRLKRNSLLGELVFGAVVLLGFLLLLSPIALVIAISFFSDEILRFPPSSLSLDWYRSLSSQPQFLSGFVLSAQVALAATFFGILFSLPASFAIVRYRFKGRESILQFLTSPLAVPTIVLGLASYIFFIEIEILTQVPIVGSVIALTAAHVLITIPWCVRLLTSSLVGLDIAPEEAALSLGAPGWRVFFEITIPSIWPAIVAAVLFSFVVSFGNLEISLFLVRPGQTTLPVLIMEYLEWRVNPTIAVVSVLQILLIGFALIVTDRFVPLSRVV